ncbi:kelch-like protein 40b [Drosophila nasuta]|uniref:kelch-like protein 40b n=1 Tax=Drosophila nasuta TaxID=42062 RepID=UPI00295E87EE|nr:kelch-like protein 40b [Drosophila nasuta]
MDEIMRNLGTLNHNTTKRDPTCSVHFIDSTASYKDEQKFVKCLVSKSEDLEVNSVLRRKPVELATNRSLFEIGHNFEDVPNWLSIEQPVKTPLKNILRYMVENHLSTTVQIEINTMYFNCHILVLQSYSKFFLDLEVVPFAVTLPEEKVSQKAFMLIYKWMISDEPILERKSILEVFVAATYLRIESLLLHCWKYFNIIECFNEDTACILYIETKRNPALDIVRSIMLTRIRKFLLTFVATRDFFDVPLNHLIYLLSSNDICVNTEVEILFIMVRWLGHDWKQRQKYVNSLIPCIRFDLMPLWYLLYVRQVETHKLIKKLINIPKVNATFNETISKITSKMYGEKTNAKSFKQGTEHRQWIQDEMCPYFHHIACPYTRNINFIQFESYLTALQRQTLNRWVTVELIDLKKPKQCCIALHNFKI